MGELKTMPLKRQSGISVQTLDNEVLIYDSENEQANCLNRTAALVWEYADGKTSVPQLTKKVSDTLHTTVDERLVWYALDQLQRKNLMQGQVLLPAEYSVLNRRQFLKRAVIVGTLVAVPTVVSLTVPSASQAASCLKTGAACQSGTQCCSTICSSGNCL